MRADGWSRYSLLEPLHPLDERVPPVRERDHQAVHAQFAGAAGIERRLVPGRESQVVVDRIAEREPAADVVELRRRNAVDGRLAALVPDEVERSPETRGEVAREMDVQLEQRIGLERLSARVIGVVPEQPNGGKELERRAPARHPVPDLPDDGRA